MTHRIAIIGAGMASLSCARTLRRAGFYVEIFEGDRVVGGRMGTSRLGVVPFDHGAQYVSVRSNRFRTYVGAPGMSALMRPLAESVRVHTNRRVHTLQRIDKGWHLWFDDQTSSGPFAAVAVAVRAPEASLILGREAPDVADQIGGVRFSPCWALIIRLE